MKEELFKAKRKDNDEWIQGSLLVLDDGCCRIATSCLVGDVENILTVCAYDVDPNTVCRYTGLTDKNGNKIWENDVLKIARTSNCIGDYYYPPLDYPVNVVVKWDLCAWMWETIEKRKHYISFPNAWCHYEAEVIGNIFDNKELLEGGETDE